MSERQTHDEHDVWFPKSPPIRSEGTDPTLYTISGEVFVLYTSFRRERQARQEAERERDQLKIHNAKLERVREVGREVHNLYIRDILTERENVRETMEAFRNALAAFGEEPAMSEPTFEQLDKAARIAIRLGHTHGAAHDVAVREIANALAEEADDVPDH